MHHEKNLFAGSIRESSHDGPKFWYLEILFVQYDLLLKDHRVFIEFQPLVLKIG